MYLKERRKKNLVFVQYDTFFILYAVLITQTIDHRE